MCFSASASFGAGIVLGVIGITSLKKSRSPQTLAFAGIPLIFSVQQFTEGFVWLSLTDPEFAAFNDPATYLFLSFAQIVWPFWVPFSILLLEKKKKRRIVLIVLTALGALISAYLGYCLISFNVESQILGRHIHYSQHYPEWPRYFAGAIYLLATIGPPFVSGVRRMWLLGTTVLISYLVTAVFYSEYIISVWCFFAAIVSASILIIINGLKQGSQNEHVLPN